MYISKDIQPFKDGTLREFQDANQNYPPSEIKYNKSPQKDEILFSDKKSNPEYFPTNENNRESLRDRVLTSFIGKKRFVYSDIPDFKCDTKPLLYWTLFLYLIEYLLIFAFQLISYLTLETKFKDSTWVTGLVLLLVYLAVCAAMILLVGRGYWKIAFVVKFFEFALHFVLLGWAVAYLDFSLMSLSYMIVLDIIVLFIFVRLSGLLFQSY